MRRAGRILRLASLTSQIAASVPGRFFEGRFLSGGENGRFSAHRGENGRVWNFWLYGIASIFLQAVEVGVTSRWQIANQGLFQAIHACEDGRDYFTPCILSLFHVSRRGCRPPVVFRSRFLSGGDYGRFLADGA